MQDSRGQFEFSLLTPITSHRSIDCFERAVCTNQTWVVLTSQLCVMSTSSSSIVCSVAEPIYICTIDPSKCVKATVSSAKPTAGKHLSSDRAGFDDDGDLTSDSVEDAAQIHDDGLSIAYSVEDCDSEAYCVLSQQDLELSSKSEASSLAAVKQARENGTLPDDVEISLFGHASCYTPEELETCAVESHLLRLVGGLGGA